MNSVGQLLSAHETHITSTHYDSHNYALLTTRSDGLLWATTSSCCCNACSSNSSSTCCCNNRCCCNTRCCNTFYSAKITPGQAVVFGGGFPRYSSSSPHSRFDIDTHETSLQLAVRRCPLSGPTSRSCTGGSVRGTNQGKTFLLPASSRRQGVSPVHPQRYQGFDPTFAQGIINISIIVRTLKI